MERSKISNGFVKEYVNKHDVIVAINSSPYFLHFSRIAIEFPAYDRIDRIPVPDFLFRYIWRRCQVLLELMLHEQNNLQIKKCSKI